MTFALRQFSRLSWSGITAIEHVFLPINMYHTIVLRSRSGNAVFRAPPPPISCDGVTSEYNPVYEWITMSFVLRQLSSLFGQVAIEDMFLQINVYQT